MFIHLVLIGSGVLYFTETSLFLGQRFTYIKFTLYILLDEMLFNFYNCVILNSKDICWTRWFFLLVFTSGLRSVVEAGLGFIGWSQCLHCMAQNQHHDHSSYHHLQSLRVSRQWRQQFGQVPQGEFCFLSAHPLTLIITVYFITWPFTIFSLHKFTNYFKNLINGQ